jgi:DNA-binding response OmpR family regulator
MSEVTPQNQTAVSFHVAIVEDEAILREEMAFQLTHHGFSVKTFESAPGFYRFLATTPNTVAVLDIGLPGEESGLDICSYLRQNNPHMGIVFLTARGLREDRLTGLAKGADAYLTKPVDMPELLLVLKRLGERFTPAATHNPLASALTTAHPASWKLNETNAMLTAPNARTVALTITELQVIRPLMTQPNHNCTHEELATSLGLPPEDWDKHRIEVIMSRLRAKIDKETGLPLPVRAVRGIGYRFHT